MGKFYYLRYPAQLDQLVITTMKNALLVDDDQITNFINQKTLERTGLFSQIDAVQDGSLALKYLQEHENKGKSLPDLILLDINMPIMGGFAFLDEFKKRCFTNKENIKVIILSSSDNAEDIKRAKDLGIDHYLTKPILGERLIDALQ